MTKHNPEKTPSALNRLLPHRSAKSHMSSMKLGDTNSLLQETDDQEIRKAYKKMMRNDIIHDERTQSAEHYRASLAEASETGSPPRTSRYGLCESKTPDVEGVPTVKLSDIKEKHFEGQAIGFTARLHHARALSAKLVFLLFRQQIDTIQGVLEVSEGAVTEDFVHWVQRLHPESIVRVQGRLRRAPEPVKTCSIHELELVVDRIHVVVLVKEPLPVNVYDMGKTEKGEESGQTRLAVSNRVRVANRIPFLRAPATQSILRIRSGVCSIFRATLEEQGFIEIHTPKLQPVATESGADVFKVNYFGRNSCLAQSPQLAKQMAISSDLDRVFEIGPVFRAENSNTHRHLTEYTGLDLEMAIKQDYSEAMDLIDELLKSIFEGIYQRYRRELDEIKLCFPHEDLKWLNRTPRLTFRDGIRLLNDSGWTDDGDPASVAEDLSTRAEIRLGQLVREKYHTDYYILDKFPVTARPFYTRLDAEDETATNSFDIFVRGQEITTGGERINDPKLLIERMKSAGVDPDTMDEYMQAFTSGAPPHAGCGIGLERVLFLLLGLEDVRNASMFPRDPKSFSVRERKVSEDVPFPEADTVRCAIRNERDGDQADPLNLGKLIANYGDSTNTSWLDETYIVWRHETTGAAVGYAKENGYALIMGNPLCDSRQYPQVIEAFLSNLARGKDRLRPIWLLISAEIEDLLASKLDWRSLSVVAEQRLNVNDKKSVGKKERQAKKADLRIQETQLGEPVPEDVQNKCDRRIEDWKEERKGTKQAHITQVRPWIEPHHRRYLWATDPEGTIQGLVVLHRLAPSHGYQVKFALDFPGSPSGCIETLVSKAVQSLASAGVQEISFGAGATEEVEFGSTLHGTIRAKMISKTYRAAVEQLHLVAKSEFREKFGTGEDRLFICYPRLGMGVSGARTVIKFFEDRM